MDSPRMVRSPLSSFSLEQTRDARARAWAFVFECWQAKQMVDEPTQPGDHDDSQSVRNKEGVSHVDQRTH
jgi:hypothetical protein